MKDILKKTALALALVMATLTASATDLLELMIAKAGHDKKVSLELTKIRPGTQILIRQTNGPVLFEADVQGEHYAKIFNLSHLAPGEYELIVIADSRDVVQPLSITPTDLTIDEDARKTFYAPVMRERDTHLDVSFFRGKITSAKLTIYDQSGKLVYDEAFDHVVKVERRYDLSKLPKGRYTVHFITDYKNYKQVIAIR